MPDRTDPSMYGPPVQPVRQPITDTVAPIRDALQKVSPEMSWLIDTVGTAQQEKKNSQLLLQNAMQNGETTESMRNQVHAAESAESALKLAEQSLEFSDEEFEKLLGEMDGMTRPDMPQMEQQGSPDRLQQIIAAGLSLADPKNAFQYGSIPYQIEKQQRQERYQQSVQRYGEQMAIRGEKMDRLEMRMKLAAQRRSEAADEVRRLADQAYRQGEATKAQALTFRAKIYDAKTSAEADDLYQAMRENFPPEFWPHPDRIKGLKAELGAKEQADKDKAKFEGEKEKADNEARVLDDFRSWVLAQYPSNVSLGPNEVKIINDEAKRVAKENNIPLAKFNKYYERTAPAQDLAQQKFEQEQDRYDAGKDLRDIEKQIKQVDLQRKKADLEKALKEETGEGQDKKAKRSRIKNIDTRIENARITTDQHIRQPLPADEEEATKYRARLRELFIDEYTLVVKKRQLLGAKPPSMAQYAKERFPALAAFPPFNPLEGTINNTGRGTSQQGNPALPPGIK